MKYQGVNKEASEHPLKQEGEEGDVGSSLVQSKFEQNVYLRCISGLH